MNLAEQLKLEISRRNTDYAASYIGSDPERFKELIELVFTGEPPLPQRAAWVVTAVCDKYPEMLTPYLNKVISKIEKFEHPGTRRSLLRYLAEIEIPEHQQGKLFDVCYKWLLSKNEPPAVKVHSMQILVNIARTQPELLREVKLIIEELTDDESAAIRARSRNILAKI